MKHPSLLRMLLMSMITFCICMQVSFAQKTTVRGTVVSDDNPNGIQGVTVSVAGTTNATSTDRNGHYQLANVNPQSSLIFSYVGYKEKTEPITGRGEVNISM